MAGKRQVVVITGASAGVGRAAAQAFARRGDRLGLLARGDDRLAATLAEVESLGARGVTASVDVADAHAVERAAELVERELGPIDVWVNNAMVSVFSPVLEMTADEYRRVTEVTYLGYVHGTLSALRRMQPRDHGVIVQVGSALAYRAIPLQSAYCAAKHAVEGFTESLRCELMHDRSGVRVTIVQLPALNTPQFGWVKSRLARKAKPVPPIYQPEVAAGAIVWASKHAPRELLVGGSTMTAVLGNKVAPGFADRYLAQNGYTAQQTSEPEDPGRADNLWGPVPGEQGAHGRFDYIAHGTSSQLTVVKRLSEAAGWASWVLRTARSYLDRRRPGRSLDEAAARPGGDGSAASRRGREQRRTRRERERSR